MHKLFFLLLIISVMVGVAFQTLLVRRVLGHIHIRKGPNKVGFIGILQPFRDAIKLQGGSNMTGTDLCVNKPHCAAAVRP